MNNKHLLTGFAIALLIYAGWRTWDYMSRFLLKDVSVTESMIIGMTFLFVTELGYMFWLHKGQPDASTDAQETTATVLVYIDLFGSLTIGFADLLVHNTIYNVNVASLDPILLFTPWVLIAANLIGYTIYFGADSERQLERARRQLAHEENSIEIEIHRTALEEIRRNKKATAAQHAPKYIKDFNDRVTGRTANRYLRHAKKLAQEERDAEEYESRNGNENEEVDLRNGKKAGNPQGR